MITVLWFIFICVCGKIWHDQGFLFAALVFVFGYLFLSHFIFIFCLLLALYIVSQL